jgi:hypothetical protein
LNRPVQAACCDAIALEMIDAIELQVGPRS